MPSIHVCPLSRLHETVVAAGASHVITLINADTPVERPASIRPDRHLFLGISDIVEPLDGHVLPEEDHVRRLLRFVDDWDQAASLVVHCWAGVSRSTAAAFIATCRLLPGMSEHEIAQALRARSAKATPNARLVAVADRLLGRGGRMVEAVAAIGRGADAFENEPFSLPIAGDALRSPVIDVSCVSTRSVPVGEPP